MLILGIRIKHKCLTGCNNTFIRSKYTTRRTHVAALRCGRLELQQFKGSQVRWLHRVDQNNKGTSASIIKLFILIKVQAENAPYFESHMILACILYLNSTLDLLPRFNFKGKEDKKEWNQNTIVRKNMPTQQLKWCNKQYMQFKGPILVRGRNNLSFITT